jgi:hypothetical protein
VVGAFGRDLIIRRGEFGEGFYDSLVGVRRGTGELPVRPTVGRRAEVTGVMGGEQGTGISGVPGGENQQVEIGLESSIHIVEFDVPLLENA